MTYDLRPGVRTAAPRDREVVLALARTADRVHQHLDWRSPDGWIGESPFLLAQSGRKIVGGLACPPDPPGTAWIRFFAAAEQASAKAIWQTLWPVALEELRARHVEVAAALGLEAWLVELVVQHGFAQTHSVVILQRKRSPLPSIPNASVRMRLLGYRDLRTVVSIDHAAFRPPWQHSSEALRMALAQAEVATVAEIDGVVCGYQISTRTRGGGHLARLAVRPEMQAQGIGRALTLSALAHFERRRMPFVTVNTQDNNVASLALYRRLGFQLTGEAYPVFQWPGET